MIEMLDLYFQYVVWLNQTLVNGIKWLITNEDAYYVFMCSIPILATVIQFLKDGISDKELIRKKTQESLMNAKQETIYRISREHEKLMNHNELMHKIKEEEKPRPIVQYSCILSANELRSKFENGQRSKSSHRG